MRSLALAMALLGGCPSAPSPEDHAKGWLMQLAQGDGEAAYAGLCDDDRQKIAALAQRHAGEGPGQYLARLSGRYAGIDQILVTGRAEGLIRIAVVTKTARLPLGLRRRGEAFCVALVEGES